MVWPELSHHALDYSTMTEITCSADVATPVSKQQAVAAVVVVRPTRTNLRDSMRRKATRIEHSWRASSSTHCAGRFPQIGDRVKGAREESEEEI